MSKSLSLHRHGMHAQKCIYVNICRVLVKSRKVLHNHTALQKLVKKRRANDGYNGTSHTTMPTREAQKVQSTVKHVQFDNVTYFMHCENMIQ